MRSVLLAVLVPAVFVPGVAHAEPVSGISAAVPPVGVAQAAPVSGISSAPVAGAASFSMTDILGTYGFGRAATIGAAGEAAGVWSAPTTHTGFGGEDLVITYTPSFSPAATERTVYTARYNEVTYPQAECERVGADGVVKHVWVSYRCRSGIAPSYTLLVR
ncbi:hypothetical protein [Actinoplanes regularis]|uniref:hypothetical protein n=1 Tax=Actinoplanes regularis TaxID=52697 RepID=UPI0024A5E498|nr:hypothetical protein [Actinoplanes regularis]GLW27406.1 hypothetical protein Areg01_03470 [Actinoplanes regularis]